MASSGQGPEIAARIRATGEDDVKSAFDRMRESGRSTFAEINRSAKVSVDSANAAVASTHTTISGITGVIGSSFGAVGSVIGGVTHVAESVVGAVLKIGAAAGIAGAAVGGGFGGIMAAVGGFVSANAEAIESMGDLSEKTGIAVETISRWEAAIRLSGGKNGDFSKGLDHLNKTFMSVAEKGDQAAIPFMRLGVAVKDQAGSLRPFSDVMNDVISQLGTIPDKTHQAQAAFEMFGDGYKSILDVINVDEQGKGLEKHLAEANKYGTVLSASDVAKIKASDADNTETTEKLRGLGNDITNIFLPLTSEANPILKWIANNRKAISSWAADTVSILTKLKEDVGTLFGLDSEDDRADKSPGSGVRVKIDGHDGVSPGGSDKVRIWIDGKEGVSPGQNKSRIVLDGKEGILPGGKNPGTTSADAEGAQSSAVKKEEKDYNFSAMKKVSPVVEALRDTFKDLWNAMRGKEKLGDTAPWLASLAGVMRELSGAIGDVLGVLDHLLARTVEKLPSTKQILDGVSKGIASVRAGFTGMNVSVEFPSLRLLGETMREVLNIVLIFGAGLGLTGDSVMVFASGAMVVLHNAFAAIRQILQTGFVADGNVFTFLNPLLKHIESTLTLVKSTFKQIFGEMTAETVKSGLTDQFDRVGLAIFNTVKGLINVVKLMIGAVIIALPALRGFAWALGLRDADGNGDAGQLLIAGLVLKVTGLGSVLGGTMAFVYEFTRTLATMGTAAMVAGNALRVMGVAAWTAFGPVGIAAIAITALAFAVYVYWDKVKAGFFATATFMADVGLWIWDKIGGVAIGIWQAFVSPFQWIWDIAVKTWKIFNDVWNLIFGDSRKAWEDLKTDWSGLTDVFMEPFHAIGHAWDALMDKMKSGWASLKGMFQTHNAAQMSNEELGLNPDGSSKPRQQTPDQQQSSIAAAVPGLQQSLGGMSPGFNWGNPSTTAAQPSIVDSMRNAFSQALETKFPSIGQGVTQPQVDVKPQMAPVNITIGGEKIDGFQASMDAIDNLQQRLDEMASMTRNKVFRGGQF